MAVEDYERRESNLFGPGFLEKASKRIEVDKTLAKVSGASTGKNAAAAKRARYQNDKSDLRSFLGRGAPATYGGRKFQRQPQSYSQYSKFRSNKYFRFNQKPTQGQKKTNSPKPEQ